MLLIMLTNQSCRQQNGLDRLCSIDTNSWKQSINDLFLLVLFPQSEHQQGSFLRHAGHQEAKDSQ